MADTPSAAVPGFADAIAPRVAPRGRPRLLLLHGMLADRSAWLAVEEALAPFAETVAMDLPGFGEQRASARWATLDELVDQLLPTVRDVSPTHVVGHSMGAIVALALAQRLPRQLRAVGLVGLPVYGSRAEGQEFIGRRGVGYRAWLASDRAAHAACCVVHGLRPAWKAAASVTPRLPGPTALKSCDHSHAGHVAALGIVFANLVPALARSATTTRIAVMHGTQDRSAPIDPVLEISRQHGWEARIVPSGAHRLPTQRPALLVRWIRDSVLGVEAVPPAVAGRGRDLPPSGEGEGMWQWRTWDTPPGGRPVE